jgi:CPA2 family monovalent cation:H+ antiporter-2
VQHLAAGSTSASTVLMQLGLVLLTLGLLAHRIGLSPIPLYLVAGLTVGEHGAVPVVTGQAGRDFIEIGAEIGAVLLLLMLGLEYAADELVVALRRNAPAGLVDLVLNATPGAALALLLGWGPVAAVALAGITWVSSSGIVTKLLDDLGQLGNRETPVIIAVLVFEDLAMAAYLPVIGALLSGLGVYAATASVAAALAAVAVVFVVALRFPGLLARLVFAPNDEVLLLRVLGLAFFVAGMTAQLDVSATVGAFLVGVSLSGPVAEAAVELLRPLRDLFAAVFFVFFGLQIDPAQLPTALPLAVGLALLTAFTKIATGWWAAQRAGIARPGRLRVVSPSSPAASSPSSSRASPAPQRRPAPWTCRWLFCRWPLRTSCCSRSPGRSSRGSSRQGKGTVTPPRPVGAAPCRPPRTGNRYWQGTRRTPPARRAGGRHEAAHAGEATESAAAGRSAAPAVAHGGPAGGLRGAGRPPSWRVVAGAAGGAARLPRRLRAADAAGPGRWPAADVVHRLHRAGRAGQRR